MPKGEINIFTGDGMEYHQICRMLEPKITKQELDRVKNYIEGLSLNLQAVKYPLESIYDKALEIKNIIDSKVKKAKV
jgi:hypothetical protein